MEESSSYNTKNKKKSYLPACPYCGKPISFFEAWRLHTQGEFTCEKCGLSSNIRFYSHTYLIASLACLLGTMAVLLQTLLKLQKSYYDILFVLVPFLLFYAAVPFLMYFEKIQSKKDSPSVQQYKKNQYNYTQSSKNRSPVRATGPGNTIVMPAVGGGKRPQAHSGYKDLSKTIVMPALKKEAENGYGEKDVKIYPDRGKTGDKPEQENIKEILEDFIGRYGESEGQK